MLNKTDRIHKWENENHCSKKQYKEQTYAKVIQPNK